MDNNNNNKIEAKSRFTHQWDNHLLLRSCYAHLNDAANKQQQIMEWLLDKLISKSEKEMLLKRQQKTLIPYMLKLVKKDIPLAI